MKGISWSWKQNKMILKQNKEREREMDGERESLENLACQIINDTNAQIWFFV